MDDWISPLRMCGVASRVREVTRWCFRESALCLQDCMICNSAQHEACLGKMNSGSREGDTRSIASFFGFVMSCNSILIPRASSARWCGEVRLWHVAFAGALPIIEELQGQSPQTLNASLLKCAAQRDDTFQHVIDLSNKPCPTRAAILRQSRVSTWLHVV